MRDKMIVIVVILFCFWCVYVYSLGDQKTNDSLPAFAYVEIETLKLKQLNARLENVQVRK